MKYIFTFESIHMLHLGNYKIMEEFLIDYLNFECILYYPRSPFGKNKSVALGQDSHAS